MTAPTIDHLLAQSGTLVRRAPGERDEYGDPTWVDAGESVRCLLEPMGSREESGDGQAVQIGTYRLFLPPATPPTGWDAITVDGVTYELEGQAFMRGSPRSGSQHHVEAYVRAVE